MGIKLIAFDLDGTFLDPKKNIPPDNIRALEEAAAKGVIIVPATGRIVGGVPQQIRELPFIRYYVTANGAFVYDALEDKAVARAEIPLEGVVSVSSREVTVHGSVSRVIVLLDGSGAELAAIPVICGGKGCAAERMAKELAQMLSLRFDAAVPEYLYDRKAARAHKKAEKAAKHAPKPVTADEDELPDDGINYDLMDDER